MVESFGKRLSHAWNAFQDAFSKKYSASQYSGWSSTNPGRQRLRMRTERTILASIFVRMSIDFASIDFRHSVVGEDEEFLERVDSHLNDCLRLDPNLDQSARAFKQDMAMTLFERGVIAVVPVDTTLNPEQGSYDIKSLRVGHITAWEPEAVWVSLYNEKAGERQDVKVDKSFCAIIENPFYDVMNEFNSTLQRLIRKLSLLDQIDEQIGANKLDVIIQLPYVDRSQARKDQAERRRKELEDQLTGSKFGIGYTDGTERITQLNRPVENTLVKQVEALKQQVYEELGMTPEILSGNADEQTLLNYFNSTIEPIATSVSEEFTRKFLTKTARTQNKRILTTRNPFKSVPINNIADIADKFTRNEIASPNEIRAVIGMHPSRDPKANELSSRNIAKAKDELEDKPKPEEEPIERPNEPEDEDNQNGT